MPYTTVTVSARITKVLGWAGKLMSAVQTTGACAGLTAVRDMASAGRSLIETQEIERRLTCMSCASMVWLPAA